jgi:PAS domain S-box-containing protein
MSAEFSSLPYAALEAVRDGVWIFDAGGCLIFINRTARGITKIEGKAEGKTVRELFAGVASGVFEACERARRDGAVVSLTEWRTERGEGWDYEITPDDHGLTIVARDADVLHRSVLDSLPAHIALLGADGKIRSVNEPWRRFARENCKDADVNLAEGADYLDICRRASEVGAPLAQQALDGIAAVLSGEHTAFELDYPCPSPDQERWMRMHVVRPSLETGGALVVHSDVTARNRAEAALLGRSEHLALLARLTQQLVLNPDTAGALGELFDSIAEALEFELYFHFQNNGAPRTLDLMFSRGLTSAQRAHYSTIEFGKTLCGQVAENCYAGFPLVANGVLLGTIAFATRNRAYLRDGERQLIQTVCDQAAVQLARSRSEAALRDRETHLYLAMDAAMAIAFEWDIVRDRVRRMQSSEESLPVTGAGYDTLEGVAHAVHPEDRSLFHANVQAALESADGLYRSEYRLLRPDGTVAWLGENGRVEFDDAGRPLRLIGISQDITARKEAEDVLRDSELRFRTLVENTGDLFWISDYEQRRLLYASPAFAEIWGRSVDEVYARYETWMEAIHPEDRDRVQQSYPRDTTAGAYDVEYRVVRPDGSIRWVHDRGKPLSAGSLIAGVAEDITARKQGEAALERYRLLSENTRDIMWITRHDGQILEVNAAAEALYGYSRDELLRMNVRDLREPSTREQLPEHLQRAASGGVQFETLHIRRDGTVFPVEVNANSAEIGGQRLILSIVRDISERKRADEALRESQARLAMAMDTAQVYSWEIEIESGQAVWSSNAARVLGFALDIMPGSVAQAHQFNHPEDDAMVRREIEKVVSGEKLKFAFEQRLINPIDNSILWLQVQGVAENHIEGKPTRIVGLSQNISERKRAEEALLRHARRQALLLEISHLILTTQTSGGALSEAIFDRVQDVLDADVCFNYSLDASTQTLYLVAQRGVPEDKLESAQVLQLGEAFCGQVAQSKAPLSADAARICSDAQGAFVHAMNVRAYACHPLLSASGELLGTLSFASTRRDSFTPDEVDFLQTICHFVALAWERETSEAQLKRQAQLLDEAHDAIFAWEWDGGIVYWNRGAERLYGYTAAEALGQKPHPFLQTELSGGVASFRAALERDGLWVGELSHVTKEGRRFDAASRLSRAIEPDGRVLVVEANRDITQRKRTEAALRAGEERLRLATAAAQMFSWETDLAAQTIHWSQNAAEVIGCAPEELRPDMEQGQFFVDPTEQARLSTEFNALLACHADTYLFEFQGRAEDENGTCKFWEAHGRILYDESGTPQRVVGVTQDVTRRKAIEAALRAGEDRFRQLADAMPQLVWTAQSDGTVDYYNARAAEYGIAVSSPGVYEWAPIVHPADLASTAQAWNEAVAASTLYEKEHRIRMANGTYRWHLSRGVPVCDEQGRVVKWYGTATDIDDNKRAEEALRASEDRFRHATEAMRGLVYEFDVASSTVFRSRGLFDLVGYYPEEVPDSGDWWQSLLHPEDREKSRQELIKLLIEKPQFHSHEYRVRHRDGHYVWVWDNSRITYDDAGGIAHMIGCTVSIHERKRAEESLQFLAEAGLALAASLEHQSALQNLAHLCVPRFADSCAIYTTSGNEALCEARHANPEKQSALESLAQCNAAQLLGNAPYLQELRAGRSLLISDVDEAVLRDMAQDEAHLSLFQQAGGHSMLLMPLRVDERFTGYVALAISESERRFDEFDRTLAEELARRASVALERSRLFHEMQRAREAAEAANLAKDQFLSVASHELRTPLTPILGWVQILRSSDEADIKSHALEVLERNARAQVQLVDDILDVSRISTGKMRFEFQPLDLAKVVSGAVESLSPTATAKKVRLLCREETGACHALGDAGRLQQVVWNLLSNAIKFTPPEGEVSLALRHAGEGWAEIEVRDSGIGIAPDFLSHVFERFRQADSSHTRRHGGLGLGLSIVKHIVDMHGGEIKAFSEGEGQGATFTVKLPLLSSQNTPATSAALDGAAARPLLVGVRVLVVDDEPDARDLIQVALERAGAQVLAKPAAREALEALPSWQPHVLVCDVNMPDMSGHQFIEQIRGHADPDIAALPALAFSACATYTDRTRSLEAGFSRHLDKPLTPDELAHAVAQLAGRYNL